MRHSIPAILLSLILAIVLQSCREVPEPALPTHEHADRTVVIYMAANNSLGSNGADVDDMDEMSAAMTGGQFPDSTKVVVFHAPYTNGKNHSLLQLERDGSWTTLKTYPQGLSSVSPERMRQALADVITLAPAAHYGLILWSHAMGWTNGPDSKPASVLRSFGLDNRQEMTITDMASALAGFKFEYIYFDCCYMGSVEVIYELRDNAPLIVASPAEVPFDGMPYQTTLPLLAEGRPVDAAKATAAHYEGRTGSYCPSTFGAIRTGALDALAEATADVYRTAIQGPLPDTFTPQRFSVNSNNNFFDLEQYVEAITTDPALLDRWRKALDDAVISQSHSPAMWGAPLLRHCGLSTNILLTRADYRRHGYNRLSWPARVRPVTHNEP